MRSSKIGEAGGGARGMGAGKIGARISAVRNATKTGKAVTARVAENKKDMAEKVGEWSRHPGYASAKSNARIQQGKWSSDKQVARYQRQEAKADIKANARGLKAANKPVSKNNAGQNASKLKVDILKNAKPLRANRTRLGKSALKGK